MTESAATYRDSAGRDICMPASGEAMMKKCAGIDASPVARAVVQSAEPPVMTPRAGKSALLRELLHPLPRIMAVTLEPSADGRGEYAAFFDSLDGTPNRFVLGDKTRNLLEAGASDE
jgi:hypothetical protein